jgi:FMN phosphatase YigB (HAD superfamily)
MRNFIICDLDGTLFEISENRKALAKEGEWEAFHGKAEKKEINKDVSTFIQYVKFDYKIIFITGRPEKYRDQTVHDILCNQSYLDFDLLMRPNGDFSSDAELKPKLLNEYLEQNNKKISDVLVALEDRDKMVRCWRDLGIPCWQVRESEY